MARSPAQPFPPPDYRLAAATVAPARAAMVAADVVGGVMFAYLVMTLVGMLMWPFMMGGTWQTAVGSESIYIVAAIACMPVMTPALSHVVTWETTWKGFLLNWPWLLLGCLVTFELVSYFGLPNGIFWPTAMTLSVGIAEEFLFRVLLLGWLVGRMSVPAALVVSSAVFGLAHLNELSLVGIANVIPQTAGGMVLGAAYLRSRNIIGPILAHAFWDWPFFLTMGAGISGGGTEGGYPALVDTLLWTMLWVYGLYLVRPRAGDGEPGRPLLKPIAGR